MSPRLTPSLSATPPYRWAALPAAQRAAVLAGWMVLGLVETIRAVQDPTSRGVPRIPWDYALVGNFPWWLVWGLFTPVIFALADRFRLDGPGWWRRVPAHLAAGGVLVMLHLPLALGLWYATNPLPQVRLQSFGAAVLQAGRGALLLELLAYGAALGLFYAIDNHRRLHLRELDAARLATRAAALEAQAMEARLEALRMEINPHFLFNTLNTVSGLVREREHAAAVTVLSRLGDLLRSALDQPRTQQVPLADELAQLALYLDIERHRFRDRLTVRMQVAPETLGCLVPALCLQPLVENALRHGIARVPGPGVLTIGSRREAGGALLLTVHDTGPGFPDAPGAAGIGLANLRARLAELHGVAAGVGIDRDLARGTRVTLRLPVHAPAARALTAAPA